MENKNAKRTLYIVVGLICFILTYLILVQFKTVQETNITEIESMRESELRTEISNWKTKYEDVDKSFSEVKIKSEEYTTRINENQESTELVEKELKESEMILGKTNVIGKGVIIKINNTNSRELDDYDLLKVVNDLREMGAEAISVNDQRIITTTAIVYIGGSVEESGYILVNDQRIRSPYEIKVIGDTEYIQGKLLTGYLESLKTGDLDVNVEVKSDVVINKYTGSDLMFRYVKYE